MVNLRDALWIILAIGTVVMAQSPVGDFVVNDVNRNLKGVGRTAITAKADGSYYYCAWLDDRLDTANFNVFAKKIGNAATNIASNDHHIPKMIQLSDAYPNPFNATTRFNFSVPEKSKVVVEVFDLLGQKVAHVADGIYPAGSHEININAKSLSSGIYIYRMKTPKFVASKKLILLK